MIRNQVACFVPSGNEILSFLIFDVASDDKSSGFDRMFIQRVEDRLVAFLRSLLYGVAPPVVVHRDGKLWGRLAREGGYATHTDCCGSYSE